MFDYIKQQTSNHDSMIASSELFKLNYLNHYGWNFQTDTTDQDCTPLRQFSSNDRRVRNSTYSPSSSLQQPSMNPTHNAITSVIKSENIIEFDKQQKRSLRFEIILEASTAVTQKAEESTITYLNRGQVYGVQLNDKQGRNVTITSTLSIAFHSSSHRRIAESYWKFWIGQQKQPEARAIDIDASQSTGISDLSFPSFDKIKFNWNGRYGSKIHVRFKCLSTDFSRIKGVKGIPLRTQMESHVPGDDDTAAVDEICFCKVKLFRDKGAERKNKDDAKQISKQLEKVYGKANEQSLPLMYNVSLPYSVFGEIPIPSTLDSFEHAADYLKLPLQMKKSARNHTRVMTAPNSLFYQNTNTNTTSSPLSATIDTTNRIKSTPSPILSTLIPASDSFASSASEKPKEYDFYNYLGQQHQQQTLPSIDTNNLSFGAPLLHSAVPLDDDLPPLSADTLYTPGTMQATPTEYTYRHHNSSMFTPFEKHHHLRNLTPDLIPTSSSPTFVYNQQAAQSAVPLTATSIYDVFAPEEIQQPLGSCSITPTQEEDGYYKLDSPTKQLDYFGSTDAPSAPDDTSINPISLLQQQLQLHNEIASNIILNSNTVSSMLLLSPPPQQKTTDFGIGRKKLKRQRIQDKEDQDSPTTTDQQEQCAINVTIKTESYINDSDNPESKKQRRRYYTSPSRVQ